MDCGTTFSLLLLTNIERRWWREWGVDAFSSVDAMSYTHGQSGGLLYPTVGGAHWLLEIMDS